MGSNSPDAMNQMAAQRPQQIPQAGATPGAPHMLYGGQMHPQPIQQPMPPQGGLGHVQGYQPMQPPPQAPQMGRVPSAGPARMMNRPTV